jgi:glycerophosphoryl diester phosphodiesterase
MKTKIIGHRGSAGLELENSTISLAKAATLNIAAIELDVRLTKDKQLIVWHDSDLLRITGDRRTIAELTLAELQNIRLPNGSYIATLREALQLTGDVPCIVEIRDNNCAQLVWEEAKRFGHRRVSVTSRRLDELSYLRKLDPSLFLYGLGHTHALEVVHLARMLGFNGIGLNYWLLNPLTYWYARRRGLSIYVYTVNNRLLVRFLSMLYPEIAVCTDHPEWFVTARRQKGKALARRTTPHSAPDATD